MKSKFNILIVEDDREHLKSMQKYLNKLNRYTFHFKEDSESSQEIMKIYFFIAGSLDQKLPQSKTNFNSNSKYTKRITYLFSKENPFSYKIVYTAFPEHSIANSVTKNGFVYKSKYSLSYKEWANELIKEADRYSNIESFEPFKNIFIYPFSQFKYKEESLFKFYEEALNLLLKAFYASMREINNIDIENKTLKELYDEVESIDNFVTNEWRKVFEQDFIEDITIITEENVNEIFPFILQKLSIFTIHPLCIDFNPKLKNYKVQIEAKKLTHKSVNEEIVVNNFNRVPESDEVCMTFYSVESDKVIFVKLDIKDKLEKLYQKNIFARSE